MKLSGPGEEAAVQLSRGAARGAGSRRCRLCGDSPYFGCWNCRSLGSLAVGGVFFSLASSMVSPGTGTLRFLSLPAVPLAQRI